MDYIAAPSPNFEDRAGGVSPTMIILHYTGMQTGQAALERLCDEASKVSAHYLVEEDGSIFQMVEESKRAWHAGKSYWAGETDINSHSIGIEIVNPGHEFGYRTFPEAQIEAVIKLCQDIQSRHAIRHVLAHSDIAPDRKEDPGELFPWKHLSEHGIGFWPGEVEGKIDVSNALREIGYNPALDENTLITAFQRHYVPEVFEQNTAGQTCTLTLSRLKGLHKVHTS